MITLVGALKDLDSSAGEDVVDVGAKEPVIRLAVEAITDAEAWRDV